MKLFCFFLIYCCSISTIWGQDYQTFESNDIHYFRENNEGMILASEIVSKEFIDGDSIFYPFKTFRLDYPGYDGFLAASWMGEKIIIQPDGKNVFFNQYLDTILIDTQVEIDESFVMYRYESGATIEATLISIEEEVIIDLLDSVKAYVMTSDEPSFDFDSLEFRIGKNSGLLDVLPFYSFPEIYEPINYPGDVAGQYAFVGQLYPKKGITKPTYYDVADFNIGDIVQYRNFYISARKDVKLTILDKLIEDTDVRYTCEKYEHYKTYYDDPEAPEIDTVTIDIIEIRASISENFFNNQLIPEKDYGDDYGGGEYDTDYSFLLYYNEPCGYKEAFRSNGLFRDDDSTGYIGEERLRKRNVYTNGLMSYSESYNGGFDYVRNGRLFFGSNKGGLECGLENYGYLTADMFVEVNKIKVFPNPSNGNITVEVEGEFDFQMYSIDGQLVHSHKNQISPHISLNSDIPDGTYFIVVTQHNIVYNQKIVVAN